MNTTFLEKVNFDHNPDPQQFRTLLNEAIKDNEQCAIENERLTRELNETKSRLTLAEEKLTLIRGETKIKIKGQSVAALRAELEQAEEVLESIQNTLTDLFLLTVGPEITFAEDSTLPYSTVLTKLERTRENVSKTLSDTSC